MPDLRGFNPADGIVRHSRRVILVLLVLTVIVGSGAIIFDTGDAGIGEFEVDDPATDAAEYIDSAYADDAGPTTQVVVRTDDRSALSQESVVDGLDYLDTIAADRTVSETIDSEGIRSVDTIVGTAAVRMQGGPDDPSINAQREAVADLSATEYEQLLDRVLAPDTTTEGSTVALLSTDYEPQSQTVDARLIIVPHSDSAPEESVSTAQLSMDAEFEERSIEGFVFGQGIVDDATSNAVGDSFTIITPVAGILLLFALGITYRDPFDVVIALSGIAFVLIWLAGLMGWLDIPMSQLLIAVPFLLIGLSVDYALHVIMRFREAAAGRLGSLREDTRVANRPYTRAMAIGLGSVIIALAATTVSTSVGFLSNVVSPLPALRDFAILSAAGIVATFIAFAVFVPAVKVEVDGIREQWRGSTPSTRAFGTTPGIVNQALGVGVSLARRAPWAVLTVALLLTIGGVAGASTIDTSFNEADFLPEDAPEWAKSLPGPLAAGTYTIGDDLSYLSESFQSGDGDSQAAILIRGEGVTDPETLVAVNAAVDTHGQADPLAPVVAGAPPVHGPAQVIQETAAENETVAAALEARDTSGDGLPNADVEGLFDLVFAADSGAASSVIERSDDGTYDSLRLLVDVRGDADAQSIATAVDRIAIDITDEAPVSAVSTGDPVLTALIQDSLLETLVLAFSLTIVVIALFLTALYWLRYGLLVYGLMTMLPVVMAVTWLVGVMALLDIPFNSETVVMASLAIGLGVDYSIHLGERILAERQRAMSIHEALSDAVTGTGGALLGSAGTTAAGFGVLALALAPSIKRFGIVTGASIVLAFGAVLLVLPSLVVLRERFRDR